jgi:DNA recombination protein RmuC
MSESIIVGVIISIVLIVLAMWLKNNIQPGDAKLVNELRKELDEKRDIAAQVPLLEKNIENLTAEKEGESRKNGELAKELNSKDVSLAEASKDKGELEKDLREAKEEYEISEREKESLEEQFEEKKIQITKHLSTIERREFEAKEIASEKQRDNTASSAEIDRLKTELVEQKNETRSINVKYSELSEKHAGVSKEKVKAEADASSQQKIIDRLKEEIEEKEKEYAELREQYDEMIESNSVIRSEKASLEADLGAQEKNNKKLKEDFEEQGKKLELKLGEIMQQALDTKIKKFDDTSVKGLSELLKPFRENLETFKKKVEEQQENSVERFASLSKEIEHVTKIGIGIGEEAQNLTKALKGKKQTQGSWGEMILESVLEHSGLLKGKHYETQTSYRDGEGNIKRPDVVIKLPQERTIIVDSKVSLNDYEKFIRAETEEESNIAAKAMIAALRNHIDTLATKDYTEYKTGTLQYVFMFIPIEGAFSTAVQIDPTLYEYALQKKIAIVNPSTLTVSLRTIYLYWQSEQSSGLAIKLFEEAGKLYDKMDGFTKSFKKIGVQLQTVNKTYDDAHKKLSEGTGNVLGRVENLRALGARTKGKLKDSIEFQSVELDMDSVEVEMVDDPELIEVIPNESDVNK